MRIAATAMTRRPLRIVPILSVIPPALAADPGPGDAFNEIALREKVNDDRRQDHECRTRHEQMVARASLAGELDQLHLDRADLRTRRDDERPEERVPRAQEREQAHGNQRRADEGERDRPEEAKMSGSIHARRILKLLRDRQEELAKEKDREDSRQK